MYEQVLAAGARTANVYFNLGNAWFKAGEPGRAVAAYRHAQQFDPRDSDLLANLEFVRKKTGAEEKPALWMRIVRFLTPNEWAAIAALSFWSLFAVLALGEVQPKRKLRGTLYVTALLTVLFGAGTGGAVYDALVLRHGVVVAREAPVRFGPLLDSQVAFQLADGAEIVITDSKGDWLQVRDAAGRRGWIKQSEVSPL